MNAPGHFLLRYEPANLFLDVFARSSNPAACTLDRRSVEGFIAGHNGLSLAHAKASLDAALRSRPTPADVCRRALRNLAAIYDDDPCGSLVTCSLAAALEDEPGAAAISPLTAAIRCKLALADGGYDRGATHDRDRVLVLAGSLRRDLDAVGALMAGDVPADQRHALGRVLAVARAHLAKFSPPFEDAEPP